MRALAVKRGQAALWSGRGSTLKRIEVNLCYEVGITQFARISRFLCSSKSNAKRREDRTHTPTGSRCAASQPWIREAPGVVWLRRRPSGSLLLPFVVVTRLCPPWVSRSQPVAASRSDWARRPARCLHCLLSVPGRAAAACGGPAQGRALLASIPSDLVLIPRVRPPCSSSLHFPS